MSLLFLHLAPVPSGSVTARSPQDYTSVRGATHQAHIGDCSGELVVCVVWEGGEAVDAGEYRT